MPEWWRSFLLRAVQSCANREVVVCLLELWRGREAAASNRAVGDGDGDGARVWEGKPTRWWQGWQ
jgi:hypothetical protein